MNYNDGTVGEMMLWGESCPNLAELLLGGIVWIQVETKTGGSLSGYTEPRDLPDLFPQHKVAEHNREKWTK